MAKTNENVTATPDVGALMAQLATMQTGNVDSNALASILKYLDSKGVSIGALQKTNKTLRDKGEITSKGRGKTASDDPLSVAIALAVNTHLAAQIAQLTANPKINTRLVKLNDIWSVNFIRKVKRTKKAKVATPEIVAAKEAAFSEPAIS